MADNLETPRPAAKFDFSAYPANSLFHERRTGRERRADGAHNPRPVLAPETATDIPRPATPILRREKKERRKRIDPTTFEKQYTDDELEFMTAMQSFKEQSGKT